MVGIIGLVIVVAVSVYLFASHGVGSTGITPGHPLLDFAAPLAATNLNGDPNDHPTCSAARHDPRALNVCLLARRGPLVLSFFVTGASQCVRQVSALQTLAARFPSVQFAAVAIGASHRTTAALIRRHHWTIPVAYDDDGRVGALYGVAACPMVEMAARGGIVRTRLIGNPWQTAASLAPSVQALARDEAPAG
jgi:peroxiredoxin